MTDTQFEVHWQRLENKYPTHFKNEDHKSREWTDWYDNFIKLDDSITQEAFDYYFRYLARNWFPALPDMLNCYNRIYKEKQDKKIDEPVKRGSLKPLHDAIQTAKKIIAVGEVPIGFTDNNVKEQYVAPAKGDTKPIRVDYTKFKGMAESFVGMYDEYWVKPAVSAYKKEKLKEKRISRPISDLVRAQYSAVDRTDPIAAFYPKPKIRTLCYYCEKPVIKNEEVFKCSKCQVEYV